MDLKNPGSRTCSLLGDEHRIFELTKLQRDVQLIIGCLKRNKDLL